MQSTTVTNKRLISAFCSADSPCSYLTVLLAGQYNEAALVALDYIVYRAGQYGVKLIAVLADNWQKADSTYNVSCYLGTL